MIDLDRARKAFEEYTSKYDMENDKVNRKYHHSYRVAKLSRNIAVSLNLSDEEQALAELIGLLHDTGRFEQASIYNSYNDLTSMDHGNYAVKILFEDKLIRNFIENDEYDNLIKKAIDVHNELTIPDNFTEKEVLYSKIIKDADKLDIFYILTNEKKEILNNNEDISNDILEMFINKKLVKIKAKMTPLDSIITTVSFIYDIYFPFSIKHIIENDYINMYIDSLPVKTDKAKKIIENIKEQANKDLKIRSDILC